MTIKAKKNYAEVITSFIKRNTYSLKFIIFYRTNTVFTLLIEINCVFETLACIGALPLSTDRAWYSHSKNTKIKEEFKVPKHI